MNEHLKSLIDFVSEHNGINDKSKLTNLVSRKFGLVRDRSVYYCQHFAIRFSASNSQHFGNTVLSLSNLQKFDNIPFWVCLVTPSTNYMLLANSSFLKKISHSSQELRVNNIRGSFNGSDIMRDFDGIANSPEYFERLFAIHESIGFDDNLVRLVERTNNISPSGVRFSVNENAKKVILEAPIRAASFVISKDFTTLKDELDEKVVKYRNEILLAALIENVNVRGRVIEYLIAGEDAQLRHSLVEALTSNTKGLPEFKTENTLGDYSRNFEQYFTQTDVKTKIMILDSNPKAYNIDKMLEFLSSERSVFMFYFVGVDPLNIVNTVLISMFQKKLLSSTITLKHWAGRNSRGVTQFEGKTIKDLILHPSAEIVTDLSSIFLEKLISL